MLDGRAAVAARTGKPMKQNSVAPVDRGSGPDGSGAVEMGLALNSSQSVPPLAAPDSAMPPAKSGAGTPMRWSSVVSGQLDDPRYHKAASVIQHWVKAQTQRVGTRRLIVQKRVRDMVSYFCFLLLFSLSYVWLTNDTDRFYALDSLRSDLEDQTFSSLGNSITFDGILTPADVYNWLRGPLIATLYGDDTNGTVHEFNYLIGVPRLGQLRGKDVPCPSTRHYKTDLPMATCVGDVNVGLFAVAESTDAFGGSPPLFEFINNTGALISLAEERAMPLESLRAQSGTFFTGGVGFPVYLPRADAVAALATINSLADRGYFDRRTRFVVLEFPMYNAMLDSYLLVDATFEFTLSGGVLPALITRAVPNIYNPADDESWALWVLEAFVAIFYCGYVIGELEHLFCYKNYHRLKGINAMTHFLNLVVYAAVWICRFISISQAPDFSSVNMSANVFYCLRGAIDWRMLAKDLISINCLLVWSKLVVYLSYAPQFSLVIVTLRSAWSETAGFLVVFGAILYGFACAHYLVFGTLMEEYRDISESVYTLISSLLGNFDLDRHVNAQYVLGPVFFIVFVGIGVVVVLNILIAIIAQAYHLQSRQHAKRRGISIGKEMVDYIIRRLYDLPALGPVLRRLHRAMKIKGEKKKHHRAKMKKMSRFKTAPGLQPAHGVKKPKRAATFTAGLAVHPEKGGNTPVRGNILGGYASSEGGSESEAGSDEVTPRARFLAAKSQRTSKYVHAKVQTDDYANSQHDGGNVGDESPVWSLVPAESGRRPVPTTTESKEEARLQRPGPPHASDNLPPVRPSRDDIPLLSSEVTAIDVESKGK